PERGARAVSIRSLLRHCDRRHRGLALEFRQACDARLCARVFHVATGGWVRRQIGRNKYDLTRHQPINPGSASSTAYATELEKKRRFGFPDQSISLTGLIST